MTKHEEWLLDQYNRNRDFKDHIHNMPDYNRVMLDLEIKNNKLKNSTKTY